MDDLDKVLKFAFELDPWSFLEPRLDWPDDFAGRRRCIGHLIRMATTEALPYEYRAWAFDELHELARDWTSGPVPPELTEWGYAVWAGKTRPPKRPRGRPAVGSDVRKAIAHRLIPRFVSILKEQGHVKTKKAAIERVAQAVGLTPDRVEDILKEFQGIKSAHIIPPR